MSLKEVRELLTPQNPFVLGKYPDRPAPQHVLNGFIAASLGISDRGVAIRRLLSADGPAPEGFTFIDQSNWKHDPAKLSALRNDLGHVFDPDHRIWKDFGSPTVIHALLANSDPSDQGFGPLIWDMVRRYVDPDYEKMLTALFMPSTATDPLTACAMVLAEGAKLGRKRSSDSGDASWYGDKRTPAGTILATNLGSFLQQLTRPKDGAKRLLQIQHLERGLYLTSILALILSPLTFNASPDVKSVEDLGAIVVWAGAPPGPASHPMVAASVRSLQLLIERLRSAIAETLSEALKGQPLPSGLPAEQHLRFALANQLRVKSEVANDLIDTLCKDAEVPINGVHPGDLAWCSQVVESSYSADVMTKGLRSMGNKIGFLGPSRGAGSPRFMCETPLLGTLIAGLCPNRGMEFGEFVDRAREQLGLVFGHGTEDNLAEHLNLWEGAGIGGRILRDNQDVLRQRLVRAGLAREYSDGHTEVIYDV